MGNVFLWLLIRGTLSYKEYNETGLTVLNGCQKMHNQHRFYSNPQVLVFEDAPNGAESGLAAGMKVVWVPDSRADRSPYKGRVDAIYDNLEQFKPEDFGLPAYEDV